MALIILRQARPNHAMLGRLPGTNIYRDFKRYPDAHCIPGVAVFRFDASLNFANRETFLKALKGGIASLSCRFDNGLSCVVIEFGSINDVDASALRMLQDLHKELKEKKVRLLLSSVKGPVREVFDRSGFMEEIKPTSLCVSLTEAVKYGARVHAIRIGKAGSGGSRSSSPRKGGDGSSGHDNGNGAGGDRKPVPMATSFDSEMGASEDGRGYNADVGGNSLDSEEAGMTSLARVAAAATAAADAAATIAAESSAISSAGSALATVPAVESPRTPQHALPASAPAATTPAWLRQAANILPGTTPRAAASAGADPTVTEEDSSSTPKVGLPQVLSARRARKFERMRDDDNVDDEIVE